MKELIDKLIEALEGSAKIYIDDDGNMGFAIPKNKAISIVNKLAEEYNNGWILCSERLPKFAKENPVTKDFYKYPCIYKNGDVVDIRYIAFGRGCWIQGGKNMNDYVVAWFDIFSTLPAPYQPKGE